jgi:hypothetical protein
MLTFCRAAFGIVRRCGRIGLVIALAHFAGSLEDGAFADDEDAGFDVAVKFSGRSKLEIEKGISVG